MENKKSILITGATSGIGKYFTEILSGRGWVVWAGYRDEKAIEKLSECDRSKVFPIRIDVADAHSIDKAKEVIERSSLPLYAVVNNAGVALGGPIELVDIEEVKRLYEVNVFGYMRVVQRFLPLLRKEQGRIINVGSVGGLISIPFMIPYCSSKSAVESFSDGLRRELANQKIKVSLLEPGAVDTDIWGKAVRLSEDSVGSGENIKYYQPNLDSFRRIVENRRKHSISMEKLKKPIIHAIESKNPKSRYLIYKYNFLLKVILKISPAKFVDGFFDFYIR